MGNRAYYEKNKEKIIARSLAYQKANKERVNAKNRAYHADNPEKRREYYLAWKARNPGRKAAQSAEWKRLNPGKANANTWTRRAKARNATPTWANDFFIREAYHLAALRTKMTGIKWNVDHIVPLRSKLVCGLHVEHNLQVISASVNRSKANRYWPQMPEAAHG